MIFGRNTQQIMGVIIALVGLVQVVVPTLWPDIDPAQLGVVLAAVTTFLGAVVALIANEKTTPTGDPRLPIGTVVNRGLPDEAVVGRTINVGG